MNNELKQIVMSDELEEPLELVGYDFGPSGLSRRKSPFDNGVIATTLRSPRTGGKPRNDCGFLEDVGWGQMRLW